MDTKPRAHKAAAHPYRDVLVNFRLSQDEYIQLKSIADAMCGGNVSAWLRERAFRSDAAIDSDLCEVLNAIKKDKTGET